MKSIISILLVTLFIIPGNHCSAQKAKKITKEDIREICQGTSIDSRPRITVSQFKVDAYRAERKFGSELAAMLTNAISSTGCFNVLETVSELDDEMEELGFNMSGATDGSGPETGGMLGSQLVITGSITEFKNNTVQILGVGSDKAHIGIILKVVDIRTRQIIYSSSFEGKSVKPQLKVMGTDVVALGSAAMEDAAERIIIEATYDLANQKDIFSKYNNEGSLSQTNKNVNCPIAAKSGQSVMVIIPEVHISRKVPDPAGETQIIKRLIDAGFQVIDPTIYASLRNSQKLADAVKDASKMAQIGSDFGADIIIFGEAFSEADGRKNGMFSCRARVEARAVNTRTGRILGADGTHAGGLDNTELVAGKSALRSAGNNLADYFIHSICNSLQSNTEPSLHDDSHNSVVIISNASFSNLSKIERQIRLLTGVSEVKKSMSEKEGVINIIHTCSLDEVAEKLASGIQDIQIEITGFEDNKIMLSIVD